MKKILVFTALCAMIMTGSSNLVCAQEQCDFGVKIRELLSKDPSFEPVLEQYRAESIQAADALELQMQNSASKSTAGVTIPVVFHVILNQQQLNSIGGIQGVRDRVTSQMEVINNDFNARNADSTGIPANFKLLYGNAAISFRLAHTKPDGTATDGFEIKTLPASTTGFDQHNGYVKSDAAGGANPWDNKKYLNIWVVNINTENLMGYAHSPWYAKNVIFEEDYIGVVLDFGAFGVKPISSSFYWNTSTVRGRTLTHELGHFFNLWHVWGNTAVGSGVCSDDDDVSDTPKQNDATQSCQPFPFKDACTPSGNGIMYMNYMDYSGDGCTRMFTKGQATRMQAQVSNGGDSYGLTTHPELCEWPSNVTNVEQGNPFNISPNPSTGIFNINFTKPANNLHSVSVINTMGQIVKQINIVDNDKSSFNIDLSGFSSGIYILQLQFTEGTITRKVMIQ